MYRTKNNTMDFTSKELSLALENTKVCASRLFNELVSNGTIFSFLKQVSEDKTLTDQEIAKQLTSDCELHLLPTIEFRSDITGDVYDAHVCIVSDKRILVITMDNEDTRELKFEDIASLEDKLILLNEMEEYLVEPN